MNALQGCKVNKKFRLIASQVYKKWGNGHFLCRIYPLLHYMN